MAPVAAGLANSDTRFHREKWPSSHYAGAAIFFECKIRQLDKHLNIEYSVRVMRDDERRSYAGRGF